MTFIENLDEQEYEKFVANHPTKSHFMQSYYWGKVSEEKKFIPHYVGLKKDNKIIASALLLEKKLIGKYCYFYCPRGFVCDYSDLEVIKIFTKHLKKYGSKKNAIFIKIDPDIKLQYLDIEGNVIDKEKNNFKLVDYLINLGYKHRGFNKNFEFNEPRYTFRLDLETSMENINKNMHPTTRKIINRGNIYNLDIYKGSIEDVTYFYETMQETANRNKLIIPSLKYYQNFYNTLNAKNMSDIYVAKINIPKLVETYIERIVSLKQEMNNLDIDKYKKKGKYDNIVMDMKEQIEKNERELEEVKQIRQEDIILSTVITTKYKDKVWTVHGGNRDLLRNLNANYWVYYAIIKEAQENNYKLVDFFGTTGTNNQDNSVYGIHLFKRRLGGEYTEFIGEFDLVINKFLYFSYTKIFSKYRELKKKILKRTKKD